MADNRPPYDNDILKDGISKVEFADEVQSYTAAFERRTMFSGKRPLKSLQYLTI